MKTSRVRKDLTPPAGWLAACLFCAVLAVGAAGCAGHGGSGRPASAAAPAVPTLPPRGGRALAVRLGRCHLPVRGEVGVGRSPGKPEWVARTRVSPDLGACAACRRVPGLRRAERRGLLLIEGLALPVRHGDPAHRSHSAGPGGRHDPVADLRRRAINVGNVPRRGATGWTRAIGGPGGRDQGDVLPGDVRGPGIRSTMGTWPLALSGC